MTERPTCVGRHDQPRTALAGTLLCTKHADAITTDLDDIALLYPLLDDVTEPGSVVVDELIRYAKRPDPQAPVRLEVVSLRDTRTTWTHDSPDAIDVIGTLTNWADVIRDERDLATRTGHATLTSEIATLRTHHEYAITQDWVTVYALELHRAAQAVRHVCGENDDRARPVGTCPVPPTPAQILEAAVAHQPEPGPCGGPLYPDRYGLMRVRCARCGEVWDEQDLRRLGLVLDS